MKKTTYDLGNNESVSVGVFPNGDGTFTAMTRTKSKLFKTEKGANNWLKRQLSGKPAVNKFRLQYRVCGVWVNGNTFPTKQAADAWGARECRNMTRYDGYQVVPLR